MSDNGRDESYDDLEESAEVFAYSELDEERRQELDGLLDLKVLGMELDVWEESAGEEAGAASPSPEESVIFDCDLFMEEDQALELYGAVVYVDPEGDPVKGSDAIFEAVGKLVDGELALIDYREADEEGGLALAFGEDEEVRLLLVANEWMVSEWEAELEGEEGGDEDDESGS
jgi:hypothetical protein